jgi:chemosensory pili system protein ChpA (sensor histidine kinase/response regulator)
LAGVLPVGDLSHALESIFIDLVEGRLTPTEDLKRTIRQVVDQLAVQLEEVESIGKLHSAAFLVEQLESIRRDSMTETEIPLSPPVLEGIEQDDQEGLKEEPASEEAMAAPLESFSYLQADDMQSVGDDPELVEIFTEEAREIMEHLEAGYQQWSVDPADLSEIDGMQRSLHTLKGSARLAGITPVGNLSHALESLLIKLVNQELETSDEVLRSSRQALDKLANQLDEIASLGEVSSGESLLEQLETLITPERLEDRQEASAQSSEHAEVTRVPIPDELSAESAVVLPFVSDIAKDVESKRQESSTQFKPSKDQVRINADLMDRLVNHAGEVSIYRARLEQQNNILGFNLTELDQTISRLFNQLRNLEIETEAQILYRWDRDNEQDDRDKAEFDPLELDRFSTMQQLSRALVETVSDLSSIYEAMADLQRETDTLLLQQSRISTDLQDGLLRTRMVPFTQLVPRLQRLVRQTGDQLGKQAQLEVFGSEGELDRNILNRMIPVLEHLLRNAVSHGIESPHDRRAGGKSDSGRISLNIEREATDVLITLADDGKGLDIEAIRAQAIRQGMIDSDAEVSDDDLIQCVLNPGFSTAKEVTQISGRGVGLDVVASEVKQLSGSLDIESRPGEGTRFTIRLPLTLAITDALLVRVGEEVYAIPHGGVEGVVRIKREELQACYDGEQQSYQYADRSYKTIYLGRMMGIENTELSENVKWFPLLLVHTGEHHVALQVDELLGTRQIVVKSVGKQIGSVRWITGGTILADGGVALILDVGALVRMDAARVSTTIPLTGSLDQKVAEERIRVMVVDDSITVRKVTGRLLERHDMEVVTAKDGVEAIALLQEQLPDIMLLDIEMPRMDGFEVARHINNSVDYYGLPIIMISSRVGDKHRQRAFQLGVKRCLGKPYQEAELLENIHEVLSEVKV